MAGTENLSVGQHVVQFCGHDGELAERVSDYLRGAFGDGGVAVVIATPEHRSDFEARLTRAGADLAAARADGTYLTLDARETLREILDGAAPAGAAPDSAAPAGAALDRAAFDRVVGSVIRQAASSGRPVRAYGELVALLWDDGLVNAAAQLEVLWDELGHAQPFSLFRGTDVQTMHPNWMILRIQPDEGIALRFAAKRPGPTVTLDTVSMDFAYKSYFKVEPSTGYETLIYDCMIGDATLFQRADNIEAGWRAVQPILDAWAHNPGKGLEKYAGGSSGPAAADELLGRDGHHWRSLD